MKKIINLILLFVEISFLFSQSKVLVLKPVNLYKNDSEFSTKLGDYFSNIINSNKIGKATMYDKISDNEILTENDIKNLFNITKSDYIVYSLLSYSNSYNIYIKSFSNNGKSKVVFIENINENDLEKNSSLKNQYLKLFDDNYKSDISKYLSNIELKTNKNIVTKLEKINVGVIPFYNLPAEIKNEDQKVISNNIKNALKKEKNIEIKENELNISIKKLNINKNILLLDEELINITRNSNLDLTIYGYVYKEKENINLNIKYIYQTGKIVSEIYQIDNIENLNIIGLDLVQKIKNEVFITPVLLSTKYNFREILLSRDFSYINSNSFSEVNFKIETKKIPIQPVKDYRNVSISQNNNIITITSNEFNKTYAYDLKTDKIITKIDEKLVNISSPAIFFENGIIIINNRKLYYQDNKELKVYDIGENTTFWAQGVIANKKLYLPLSGKILEVFRKKDSKSIDFEIKKISFENESKGQVFINKYEDRLYISNSFQGTIIEYDINNNKILNRYDLDISSSNFTTPMIFENYLFTSDIKENIFIIDLNNKNIKKIKTNIGSNSNIIFYKGNLFFIGNDGYLYKVNKDFDLVNKIIKVDINTRSDNYLNRKIVRYNDFILFNSDTNKLFIYNIDSDYYNFFDLKLQQSDSKLIATPVIYDNIVYLIDSNFFVYKIKMD